MRLLGREARSSPRGDTIIGNYRASNGGEDAPVPPRPVQQQPANGFLAEDDVKRGVQAWLQVCRVDRGDQWGRLPWAALSRLREVESARESAGLPQRVEGGPAISGMSSSATARGADGALPCRRVALHEIRTGPREGASGGRPEVQRWVPKHGFSDFGHRQAGRSRHCIELQPYSRSGPLGSRPNGPRKASKEQEMSRKRAKRASSEEETTSSTSTWTSSPTRPWSHW